MVVLSWGQLWSLAATSADRAFGETGWGGVRPGASLHPVLVAYAVDLVPRACGAVAPSAAETERRLFAAVVSSPSVVQLDAAVHVSPVQMGLNRT